MKPLNDKDLINVLNKFVLDKSKDYLVFALVCKFYLQKVMKWESKGLDLIKGKVISIRRKTNNKKLKVPHIS